MSDDSKITTIGKETKMRIALVIVVIAGAIVLEGRLSRIETKVDVLIQDDNKSNHDFESFRTRIEALERMSEMFNSSGSPALRARIDVLEKTLASTIRDLEVHKAATAKNQ